MEFIIDTVNLEEIKDAIDHMPIVGDEATFPIVKSNCTRKTSLITHEKSKRYYWKR